MRVINFTFDTDIELGVGDRRKFLDLHNSFDWQGVHYISSLRRVLMSWTRGTGSWVLNDLPPSITLEFRGVSGFAACPRDSDLPYSEDDCLSSVTFSPPEFSTDFDARFEGYRSDTEHIMFNFRSGFGLKIWSDEVELSI